MDPHPDAFHFLPAYQLAQLNLLELQSPSGAFKFSGFELEWFHLPVFRIGVNNPSVTSPFSPHSAVSIVFSTTLGPII